MIIIATVWSLVNGTVVILVLERYEHCIRYPVLYSHLVFGLGYCITVL